MSASIGARSRLAIKAQPDYIVKATGNFAEVPMSTFSLETVKAALESATIRSDREVQDWRHGARNATGQVVSELRFGDTALELLMQSAMFNTWVSNEITLGTTRTFLSAEDQALDRAIYRMGIGLEVSRMEISVQPGQMVSTTFDLIGRDVQLPAATGAGVVTAATTNEPMDAFTAALFDEVPTSGQELNIVTGFSFQLDNGIRPINVVGDPLPPFQEYGRARVTGSLTMMYTGPAQLARFLNETPFALDLTLADQAGNDYKFTLPRCKYSAAQVPVANEMTRMITLPFVALRPTSGNIGSALRIQR